MKQTIDNTENIIASKITKIVKMGDQYIFCIPKVLVDSGVLDLESTYKFSIRKLTKKEEKEA